MGLQLGPFLLAKLIEFNAINVAGQTELLERPYSIPVKVYLIPLEAMPGGNRMSMVVVMPAFPKRHNCHPPTICGKVTRGKAARTPAVSRRINQPGAMQAEHCAQEQ